MFLFSAAIRSKLDNTLLDFVGHGPFELIGDAPIASTDQRSQRIYSHSKRHPPSCHLETRILTLANLHHINGGHAGHPFHEFTGLPQAGRKQTSKSFPPRTRNHRSLFAAACCAPAVRRPQLGVEPSVAELNFEVPKVSTLYGV